MRKLCAIIQSLLLRRQNHHYSYSSDREKYNTLLISIRRVNIAHDVINVEQHELFGIDAGRLLPDVTSKRANPLTVVEVVQSRFLLASTGAEAIGHVCQTHFEFLVGDVQEARTWNPIPLRAILLQRPVESPHERIPSGTYR